MNIAKLYFFRLKTVFVFLGIRVTQEQIDDVMLASNICDVDDDYMSPVERRTLERVLPFPENVESKDFKDAYIFVVNNVSL